MICTESEVELVLRQIQNALNDWGVSIEPTLHVDDLTREASKRSAKTTEDILVAA